MKNTKLGELVDTMKRFGHLLHTKRYYVAADRVAKLAELGIDTVLVKTSGNTFIVILAN